MKNSGLHNATLRYSFLDLHHRCSSLEVGRQPRVCFATDAVAVQPPQPYSLVYSVESSRSKPRRASIDCAMSLLMRKCRLGTVTESIGTRHSGGLRICRSRRRNVATVYDRDEWFMLESDTEHQH